MISSAELNYFTDGIKQGIRADGRSPDAIRKLKVELGSVLTANGSSRVRSRGCDIIVAIKCDITKPSPKTPDEGLVSVSVEFGCAVTPRLQDFIGRQANIEAETLAEIVSNHVTSMCFGSFNKKQLCIQPGKACWEASIDILVERIDGPLLDPISIGIRAALMDLELPIVALRAEEDSESSFPIVELTKSFWRPSAEGSSAICVTMGVYCDNSVIMVDLDRVEESMAKFKSNCLLTIAVDTENRCCGVHKFGTGSLDPAVLKPVLEAGSLAARDIGLILRDIAVARQ